jgi:hypothetical protein
MTRYSNPLPPNQVPNTQARPAGPGPSAQAPRYEPAGWPAPSAPRTGGRPVAPAYGEPGGYPEPQTGGRSAHHDPYAALRPDGYGYSQPQAPQQNADPYGLAGYTAPQPQPPSYGHAPQPAAAPPQPQPAYGGADPYGASNGSAYGTSSTGAYGASNPAAPLAYAGGSAQQTYDYGTPQAPAPSFGSDYGYGTSGQGQWGGDHYGDASLDPALGTLGGYPNGPHAQHGSFDQSYAEDDVHYEDEPRRGGGWKKIVGLVACTVLVGGGLTVAYSSIMGPGEGKDTPLVKGASGPSKVKPSEPGGKQFAHADSKIMGRLGDGDSSSDSSESAGGVRKVPVVTVGRDGSIQPPSSEEQTSAVVSVPGLTVIDGFGGGPSPTRSAAPRQESAPPPVKMVASAEERNPVVAPPKKTAILADDADVKPKKPAPPVKKEKVAAVASPASTGPKPTGAGYVAVLASVPASGSSRIEALKQFADMQQKYTSILQNKTPDVQEADLGEKGTYHRLLVGPPGSRDSASSVCTQLKAQGYSGCWVTAY